MKQVLGGRCVRCGREFSHIKGPGACPCGGMLDIVYDYSVIRRAASRETISGCRDYSMWRYRAFLPVGEDTLIPPLRVGWSPLYRSVRLARLTSIDRLYVKDDGLNPTGSLKDRASAMAVAKAQEAGASVICCASTGNAGSSLAGNAAAAGMDAVIFIPSRAPRGKVAQLKIFGAMVVMVEGSYEDAFRLSAEAIGRYGWYDRNAAVNPFMMEGKKTVSFEIAEQLGWQVPDWVAVSVGDGCTIAGVWKGFTDLFAAGLIDRLPRLVSVQAANCCPIHRALHTGGDVVACSEDTIADSIAVGVPRNPAKAIRAIRESNGITVEVEDGEILEAMSVLGRTQGVFAEPAGAAGLAGLMKAVRQGLVPKDASAVAIVTGNGLKDTVNAIRAAGEPMRVPPDFRLPDEWLFRP